MVNELDVRCTSTSYGTPFQSPPFPKIMHVASDCTRIRWCPFGIFSIEVSEWSNYE